MTWHKNSTISNATLLTHYADSLTNHKRLNFLDPFAVGVWMYRFGEPSVVLTWGKYSVSRSISPAYEFVLQPDVFNSASSAREK